MILTTHVIAGAAIGSLLPAHPVAAFVLGVGSHYVLDSIPHWDYPLYSILVNKGESSALTMRRALVRDFFDISLDFAAALIVSLVFFYNPNPSALVAICAGVIGGVLPDFLQFVYMLAPNSPIKYLQQFHRWIHTSHRLRNEGKTLIGVVSQIAIVAAIIFVAKVF